MSPRLLRPFAAAVILAGFAAAAPRASAEFVTLKYEGATSNPSITSNLYANAPAGPFYWTENNLPPNTSFPPPTATFCIELNAKTPAQILPQKGDNVIFDVKSLSADPAIGATKATYITELYGKYYDTAWDSASFKGSAASTSFQIALWELVYDGSNKANTTSLDDGAFYIPGMTFTQKDTAQTWLNGLTGNASSFYTKFAGKELVALIAPGGVGAKSQDEIQDQITMRPIGTVPGPGGLVLAGIGLVTLAGRARFRRPTA